MTRDMIGRTGLELAAQPPVRFGEIVIGHTRKQMVERVIAEAHRRP